LIAERGRTDKKDIKAWDRMLTTLNIFPTLGVPIIAGLDERVGWSPPLAVAIQVVGLIFFALAQGLFTWAMVSNKFFSTSVRIQADRDHTVASGGPYQYVRHPGYVGYIVSSFATCLALDSLWALIPAGLTMCLLIVFQRGSRCAFSSSARRWRIERCTRNCRGTLSMPRGCATGCCRASGSR
jgi:protein-S-isoprenylcysteine O-methyltransferase Ste14